MKARTEDQELGALTSDQLKKLYHKINSKLAQNLLSGTGLQAETQRIQMLNKISEELNRRNVATRPV